MIARARSIAVVMTLLGGAVAIVSSTQTWFDVALAETTDLVAVPGASALNVLAPLSLAALALGLALTLVGRVLRYVGAVVAVGIGSAIATASIRIAIDQPVDAYSLLVTEKTGIAGAEAIASLVSGVTATPWPIITVIAGGAIALAGVLVLASAHRWSGAGRRYRTDAASVAHSDGSRPYDAIDSWDDLSRGEDPTD